MKTKLIILMAVLMLFVNLSAFSASYSDISGNEYENDINILTVLGDPIFKCSLFGSFD